MTKNVSLRKKYVFINVGFVPKLRERLVNISWSIKVSLNETFISPWKIFVILRLFKVATSHKKFHALLCCRESKNFFKILICFKHIFVFPDLQQSREQDSRKLRIINEILNNLLFVFKVSF